MKINLELNLAGENLERKFLNFWDWRAGKDVIVEIIENELWLQTEAEPRLITLEQFIGLVKHSIPL